MSRRPTNVSLSLLSASIVGLLPLISLQAEETTPPADEAKEQTIRGEIVDPAGYLKEGRSGPEMSDQTYEAVDGGQTLALLAEADETLYLLLAEVPGEDPNELAYDYVNQRVEVTGPVYTRGRAQGIVANTLQPVDAPPPSNPP